MINLSAGACVRSLSVDSECNKCELVCPTNAIVIGDNTLPSINFSTCVTCGACGGVCPNEALALEEFNTTNFFFDFLEEESDLLSCRKNVPCISALSVEHIISLAILKKGITFDMGYCDGCDIASTCKPQILKNHEEATYLLEAMESDVSIKLEDVSYESETKESGRREFLSAVNLQSIAKVKKGFEDEVQKANDELVEHSLSKTDIALIRKKSIPNKRKILFTAIKRVEKPSQFHVIDGSELSFTSTKLMKEDACTACQMCYRVCPTGALTSDMKNSKIDFDPFMCIKCHVCHDVCAPDAITLSSSYNVKEFFEPTVQNLVSFSVQRCDECNAYFSTNSGDKLCYRCKIEEEEAKELWGIE
ncbi:4Fe-4S dicluster domain-containing protein [Sulfurimonas aquatica]|uniref:4Fe-4S dicluster domain-containing protein n=1 Tax=Sulfurimonas aquatica TaxID=2672570 RepID=A0A975AZF2_9BACT|nr:4Fe-4S dicluster domain-containing protein [Sulfurimonas aquatica]QSZ41416.1 4Fe-4S dicluster domain-containing protein [Sulfurimonas aquatica]